MSIYKQKKNIGGLYALCAATCSETYHHWRVFTSSSDGACIEIDRSKFEGILLEYENIRFDNVEYLILKDVERLSADHLPKLPFLKRYGFAAEYEYRVVAETTEEQEPAFKVGFPASTISKIILNPWLPESIVDSVKSTLRGIPGCENLPVTRSTLINNARWQNAGDFMVGKRKPKSARKPKAESTR